MLQTEHERDCIFRDTVTLHKVLFGVEPDTQMQELFSDELCRSHYSLRSAKALSIWTIAMATTDATKVMACVLGAGMKWEWHLHTGTWINAIRETLAEGGVHPLPDVDAVSEAILATCIW